MKELIELIEKVKTENIVEDVCLLCCGENFLSDVDEYYGYKVAHLPESKSFPEQNNNIYIIPIDTDCPIKYIMSKK